MQYKITINGTVREVTLIERKGSSITFECEGTPYTVDISPKFNKKNSSDLLSTSTPSPKPSAPLKVASSNSVVAPMPGTVVSVQVKAGEKVTRGAILMVIEAMKMENNITSPRDGTIKEVLVEAGKEVDNGQALLAFG